MSAPESRAPNPGPRPAPPGSSFLQRLFPLFCIWLPALTSFSLPGRHGPDSMGGLDWIALVKVGSRGTALLTAAALLLTVEPTRRRALLRAFAGLLVFCAWAVLSTAWSPLKTISLGQSIGLSSLAVTAVAAAACATRPGGAERLCGHLFAVVFVATGMLLIVHSLASDLSGLDSDVRSGHAGLVHPTAAAATASLTLFLVLAMRRATAWRWPSRTWLSGSAMGLVGLYVAQRRMALALTALGLLAIAGSSLGTRFRRAGIAGLLVVGLVLFGSDRLSFVREPLVDYARRGMTIESLLSLNGRTTLWHAIVGELDEAPWRGHGYFVTSPDGVVEVWQRSANFTAHNVPLQVLASTGLIGLALFTLGLTLPLARVRRRLRHEPAQRRQMALVLAGWYTGWSLLCSSFMGPVRPESIVFFSLLGIATGWAMSNRTGW